MRSRRGFTLVEVLLAMVIVGASFAIIAEGLAMSARSTVRAQAMTESAQLAGRKLAEVEAGAIDLTQSSSGAFSDPYAAYSWEVVSTPTSTSNLYDITVRVKWIAESETKSYELRRYLCSALKRQ